MSNGSDEESAPPKQSLFDLLGDESDDDEAPAQSAFNALGVDEDEDDDDEKKQKSGAEHQKKNRKAKETNQADEDIDAIMASLNEPSAPAKKGKKNKNKNKKKKKMEEDEDDIDALLAQVQQPSSKPESIQAQKKENNANKKKSQKAPAAADDDDIDALLAEVQQPAPKSVPTPQGKGKGKGKGKSSKKTTDGDDIDALLAELEISTPAPSKKEAQKEKKPEEKKSGDGDLASLMASLETGSGDEKASEDSEEERQKKKKKKKKKTKKAAKEEPKPKSDNISALQKRVLREKEERERLEKERLEAMRAAEEKNRLEEEAERQREIERQKKAEQKRLEKEELRRQGKLLSKTQRAQKAKNEAFLAQMKAQGLVPNPADSSSAPARTQPKKKFKKLSKRDRMLMEEKKANERQRLQKEQEEREKAEAAAAAAAAVAAEKEKEVEVVEAEAEASEGSDLPDEDEEKEWDAVEESEESSGSVIDAWDMDSDEERRLRSEKVERRAKRAAERAAKRQKAIDERARRLREKEQKAKLAAEQKAAALRQAQELRKQQQQQQQQQHNTSDESADDSTDAEAEQRIAESRARRQQRRAEAMSKRSKEDMRSPICCILGHVDTGKTKILDRIRNTNVQKGEAGGITQQIGASYFPMEIIQQQTKDLNSLQTKSLEYRLPGLLIIDTPGHESFTNLRSRGSSLCDIAILVVDIMHGLEPQTLESLNMLRAKKTPFVVALNKIDRMYNWKEQNWAPFPTTFSNQSEDTQREFETRVKQTIVEFAEQGLNCDLYFRNKNFKKTISLVPTSAITGEGLPDLLMLLTQLTQNMMSERLQYISDLECTVLEVKVVDGIGHTIDVILSNGVLNVNDTIVVCGLNGPIVTTIRALLTPHPLKELRVKGDYMRLKTVKAAAGIKVVAVGLDDAVAGSQLLVLKKGDDIEDLKDEVMGDLATILSKVDKSGRGVCVQASTLGSLEALLQFLSDMKIPVSGINIGPVHKKDVIRSAIMLEHQREFAVILAFDVKVTSDAKIYAQEHGVKIFTAEIIYHLFDQFTAYMKEIRDKEQAEAADEVVFPVVLSIVPNCVFRMKDPIVLGVTVDEGILRTGCPLCVAGRNNVNIGVVSSIQANHKEVSEAKKGDQVAIKIESTNATSHIQFGRHFDESSELYSRISRRSIDVLKSNFRNVLSLEDWQLVKKLKMVFDIQ